MARTLLPEWIGLALTPLAIVGTVVLLATQRPLANSLSFAASFGVVYTILSLVIIALGNAADAGDSGTNARDVVSLVVGLLFLCIALALILRPVKQKDGSPRWAGSLEAATPGKIFATGTAASLVNPNVAILLSGLTIVITAGISTSEQITWSMTMVLASLVPFLIPILVYLILGDTGKDWLHRMMRWMVAHDRAITIGTLLLFGVMFAGRGLAGLM